MAYKPRYISTGDRQWYCVVCLRRLTNRRNGSHFGLGTITNSFENRRFFQAPGFASDGKVLLCLVRLSSSGELVHKEPEVRKDCGPPWTSCQSDPTQISRRLRPRRYSYTRTGFKNTRPRTRPQHDVEALACKNNIINLSNSQRKIL